MVCPLEIKDCDFSLQTDIKWDADCGLCPGVRRAASVVGWASGTVAEAGGRSWGPEGGRRSWLGLGDSGRGGSQPALGLVTTWDRREPVSCPWLRPFHLRLGRNTQGPPAPPCAAPSGRSWGASGAGAAAGLCVRRTCAQTPTRGDVAVSTLVAREVTWKEHRPWPPRGPSRRPGCSREEHSRGSRSSACTSEGRAGAEGLFGGVIRGTGGPGGAGRGRRGPGARNEVGPLFSGPGRDMHAASPGRFHA